MISVESNIDRLIRDLTDAERKQLPFAIARSLTWTAQEIQTEVRRELPRRFIIRNTWVSKGIRITPADKRNMTAEVGSLEDFMERQEEGGTKYPTVGKHLAIPIKVKGTKRGIIRDKDRPKALLEAGVYRSTRKRSNRVFKIDETTDPLIRHGLPMGIYASHPDRNRKGKNRLPHRQGNKGLTLLYALEPKGDVKERWEFEKTALRTVERRFDRIFKLSLDDALKGAR